MRKLMVAGAVLGSLVSMAGLGRDRVKVLGWGHDLLRSTPSDVLANAEAFDRSGFDGTCVMVQKPGGYNFRLASAATNWNRTALSAEIPVLRRFGEHKGLRESLLLLHFAPKTFVSWQDDAAWMRFSQNMGTAAWLAREGGLKGLFLDPEDYLNTRQFIWDEKRDGLDYEVFCDLVRRRGAQIGAAIFRNHPAVVIVASWFLSMEQSYFVVDDPAARQRTLGDVWPAFYEGLLSVAPPTAVLVDGDEHGYLCDADRCDFFKHAWNQWNICPLLLSERMRGKYLEHLSVGFGIYPDKFINKKGAIWYSGPGADGTRVSRFTADLAQASHVADRYVWVYGEQCATVAWKPGSVCLSGKKRQAFRAEDGTAITWEMKLPGFVNSVRLITDGEALARETISCATTNLVNFAKAGFWQDSRFSKGSWEKDGTDKPAGTHALLAKGVTRGCFTFSVPALPGELYAVAGAVKGKGRINVTWSSSVLGLSQADRRYAVPRTEKLADGWERGSVTVCVPPGMNAIAIHATPEHKRPGDVTKFADIRVVKVKP